MLEFWFGSVCFVPPWRVVGLEMENVSQPTLRRVIREPHRLNRAPKGHVPAVYGLVGVAFHIRDSVCGRLPSIRGT